MEQYIEVLEETTKRQGFYAHSPEYFRKMWRLLGNSGLLHIFTAVYEGKVLSVWILFILNGVLYYPYGASRNEGREVMPNNLMMWEMIRFGKRKNCHTFDMWGSLGPDPNPKDPWYGFHKFKKGYSGILMEFIGTYDLVIDSALYPLFRIADNVRWTYLRLRAKLPF
jgi:lipid II:glycine glycyltransferase (peptidoglycan interpeptide bridge formation enzyme)